MIGAAVSRADPSHRRGNLAAETPWPVSLAAASRIDW
jgi:hypothetical protein